MDVQEAQLQKLGGLHDPEVVPGVIGRLHLLHPPLQGRLGASDGHPALDHLLDLVPHHLPAVQPGRPLGMVRQHGIAL